MPINQYGFTSMVSSLLYIYSGILSLYLAAVTLMLACFIILYSANASSGVDHSERVIASAVPVNDITPQYPSFVRFTPKGKTSFSVCPSIYDFLQFTIRLLKMLRCHLKCLVVSVWMIHRYTKHFVRHWQIA